MTTTTTARTEERPMTDIDRAMAHLNSALEYVEDSAADDHIRCAIDYLADHVPPGTHRPSAGAAGERVIAAARVYRAVENRPAFDGSLSMTETVDRWVKARDELDEAIAEYERADIVLADPAAGERTIKDAAREIRHVRNEIERGRVTNGVLMIRDLNKALALLGEAP